MTTDRLDELFDVVDEHDRVVSQATRGEVHRQLWLHRAVHVFVLNSRGELLLQRRSATKDHCPLKLDSSCSGHLNAGEDYDTAAVRELFEEVGLDLVLQKLHKFAAAPELAYEHTWLYVSRSDAAPRFDPIEIASLEYSTPAIIQERITTDRDQFTVCFQVLFDWFVTHWWPAHQHQWTQWAPSSVPDFGVVPAPTGHTADF